MGTIKTEENKNVFITFSHSLLISVFIISLFTGCASNGSSRGSSKAASGALVGAGVGLLVGALTGDSKVAARAMVVGAGAGAYEGWKQDQDDERTRQITEAIRESKQSGMDQPGASAENRAREELTRFLGVWAMEGWFQEPGEERYNIKAQVNGNIEMKYFVELAYIDVKVAGIDDQVWGSSTLGYDKGEGYSISTRLNTLPEPVRSTGGTFDKSSRSFIFKGVGYRINIRFNNPDRFTIETFVTSGKGEQQVESYTFTQT